LSEKRFVFKIMVIGDPSVGKTSLIKRYVENAFSEEYITTLGVDFLKKDIIIDKTTVSLVIWDVAGQSKFATFKKIYYAGARFIIVVFDLTNKRTYQNIEFWLRDSQIILGDDINFAIFGNKADLVDERQVSNYDSYKKFDTLFDIVETSAKTGKNVQDIFTRIGKYLLHMHKKEQNK
jgi:small GTP-binding protein